VSLHLHLLAAIVEIGRAVMGWGEAIRRWSMYLNVTGLSVSTITKYRHLLVNFLADTLLLDGPISGIDEDMIVSYIADIPAKGSKRSDCLRAFRSFFGWAESKSLCESPVRRLKPKNPKYGEIPGLKEDELTRIILALAWREPRRAWAVLLLYGTGARIASLCAVRPEDVRGGEIHFEVTKGSRPYSVPLGPTALAAASHLAQDARTETLVGVGPERVRQWLREAQRETGVKSWPHLYRHAFGTKIAQTTDEATWIRLMNHADASQFHRYAHTDDKRKREAVAKL
jgi:integrase